MKALPNHSVYDVFMSAQEKHYVLFDFDGVIADSFAASYAIVQKFCAHITHDHFRAGFEGNIHDAFDEWESRPHGLECDHGLDWDAEYGAISQKIAGMFPGIDTVIKELAQKYRLIIVSSGPDEFIEPFLEKVGIRDCFQEVMGNRVHKSKAEKMRMIFSKYGTTPETCILITDSLGDMREGASVGVGSIGVSWGFQDRATLQKGAPFRIVDDPRDIPNTVENYFAAPSVSTEGTQAAP